jgi:putative phage-type endonuclease
VKRIIYALVQGTPEWLHHRTNFFNASDAPAMMGCSPYKSRSELLRERATGVSQEISDATQRLFDDGHRFEALARPLAEEVTGADLYPSSMSMGQLAASLDGVTMDETIIWEHKTLNAEIRAAETAADLGKHYRVQMEQQLLISGAERCLFQATRWSDIGELVEEKHFWYVSDPELQAAIVAGWLQFAKDLETYVPAAVEIKSIGRTPETLPALRLEVTGMVTASNLAEFKEHALAVFGGINRELTTDQQFADAEKTVKWCGEVEARLAAAKEHALSQTESIDLLFKTIDDISAEARAVRLELDKLVTRRKVEIKEGILAVGKAAYQEHIDGLRAETGAWIVLPAPDFIGAAKGKRTMASIQDAVDTVLANAKIEADASAKRIRAALACIKEDGAGFEFLFADKLALIVKPMDDLRLVIKTRIADHQAAESARQERERARIQEEERIKAEAKVRDEQRAQQQQQTASVAATFTQPPAVGQPYSPTARPFATVARPARPAVDNRPPITTGALCALAGDGFTVTAAFIQSLGITPVERPKESKSGTYWAAADVPTIFNALARHFAELAANETALAA